MGWGVVIADDTIHTTYITKVLLTTITLTGEISTRDLTATGGTTLGTTLGHPETERTMLQPRRLLRSSRVIGWEGRTWAWYGGGEVERWSSGVVEWWWSGGGARSEEKSIVVELQVPVNMLCSVVR